MHLNQNHLCEAAHIYTELTQIQTVTVNGIPGVHSEEKEKKRLA